MRSTTGVLSLLLFVVMALVFATGVLAQGEGPPDSEGLLELVGEHGLTAVIAVTLTVALIGIVWFVVKRRNPLGEPKLPAVVLCLALPATLALGGCGASVQKAAGKRVLDRFEPVVDDLSNRANATADERKANKLTLDELRRAFD